MRRRAGSHSLIRANPLKSVYAVGRQWVISRSRPKLACTGSKLPKFFSRVFCPFLDEIA